MPGDLILLYRVVTEADVIFRAELDELCAAGGAVVHYLVGDHTGAGRDLLAPAHLLELVPDITERDVFLCGPPAMAALIRKNVRHARVPRRQVHAERFALI
jgi:ferredoxin-NADP reductase